MKITTTTQSRFKSELPGSIGRVWAVDGVTKFHETLLHAAIEVGYNDGTDTAVRLLATGHEVGHVGVAQDLMDVFEQEAPDYFRSYDRWQNEVEAWARALDEVETSPTLTYFHFILDCLNSYRRALPASDAEWADMVELMTDYYNGDPDDLRNYVPLEPDPMDEPPTCGFPYPAPPGERDTDEEQDGSGDGGEKDDDGEAEDQDGEEEKDGTAENEGGQFQKGDDGFQNKDDGGRREAWLRPEILDDINDGADIGEVAGRYDLDPAFAPPLINVLIQTRK